MIPKIIHYCWLSQDPIPTDMKRDIQTLEKNRPDYQFIKWDFNLFDKETSKWVKQAYEKKKYAFAADYIRLYALYTYGGIYLDMDVEVLKSFTPLLYLKQMLCYESDGNKTFEAATIGAEKGADWIYECLKYYENRDFIQSNGELDLRPIPQIMREILNNKYKITEISTHIEQKYTSSNEIFVLPATYFSPKSYITGQYNITEKTFSIHQFSGSWLPWYVKLEKVICKKLNIKYKDILNRLFFSKTTTRKYKHKLLKLLKSRIRLK